MSKVTTKQAGVGARENADLSAFVAPYKLAALLLVGSGASSLVFQLLWIKQLSLIVGVEVHAVTAVVSAYFLGLAFGAYVWGRVADRVERPLRLYGAIEIGVAILGVCATFLLARSAPWFAHLESAIGAGAWVLPFALVGLPAALMGGTLPVVARAFTSNNQSVDVVAGGLYAANTAGAVIGALLPPFALIPAFGIMGSACAAAAISAMIGVIAFGPGSVHSPRATASAILRSADSRRRSAVALALYGAAGAVALGYEIVWSQALAPFVSTRVFAFSVVLATYLCGLAVGSALLSRFKTRIGDNGAVFGLLIAAAGLFALIGLAALAPWLAYPQTEAELAVRTLTGSELAGMCARFLVAALVAIFPTTVLLGAALPAALGLMDNGENSGRTVGFALAANTFGGVAGAILTGFFLIPRLGIVRSLDVLALSAAVIGVASLSLSKARAWGWRGGLALVVASCAVAFVVPADHLARVFPFSAGGHLAFYEEGRGGTVAVVEQGDAARRFHRLYIQGVSNSGDAMPSLRYMRLQALLPLLIHNGEPRSALVIGYGTGITAGALLTYPDLERRVVAELLPAVVRAAPLFNGTNHAAADPRLDIRLFDGRRELQRSRELYDLITLEPPPPSAAGVVNLYSSDFYRLAASRLEPKGIVAQWLPLPTQNEDDTRSLVRSFLDVFPHVSLWTTELHETLLVGSPDPIALDFKRIRERFSKPEVSSALAEVGVNSAEALLATYVMGRDGLQSFVADAPPVTDDQPRIEYASWLKRGDFGLVLPDLMNLREDAPIVGADDEALAAIAARREELLTFYHAGLNAFAGNRQGWADDMRAVFAADPENPYYRWFETE